LTSKCPPRYRNPMRNIFCLAAVFTMFTSFANAANNKINWVVDAYPAAFVVHSKAADYQIEGNGRSDQLGSVSTFPNIGTGVGLETQDFRLDVLGGAGVLVNGRLSSYALYLSGALMYEVARSARIGPRVGLLYFMGPEWNSDVDISYDSAPGYMLGMNMEMGDKISYLIAVDLWSSTLDTSDPVGAYTASDSSLDLSGIALQFGIRGRF
jgi:hypothetical protein